MSLICPTCGQPNLGEEALNHQIQSYNARVALQDKVDKPYYMTSSGVREIKRVIPDVRKAFALNPKLLT